MEFLPREAFSVAARSLRTSLSHAPRPSVGDASRSLRTFLGHAPSPAAEAPAIAAPVTASAPSVNAAATVTKPRIAGPFGITIPSFPARPADSRIVLIAAAMFCLLLVGYSLLLPGAGTADHAAAPAAKSAKPAKPAAVPPFAQARLNTELRALRAAVHGGESVRNLMLLADGSMGILVAHGNAIESIMSRDNDVVREPISDGAAIGDMPSLNLDHVHGIAPRRILDIAEHNFGLATAKLESLKLAPNPRNVKEFVWTASYDDAASSTLYADQEGVSITETMPR